MRLGESYLDKEKHRDLYILHKEFLKNDSVKAPKKDSLLEELVPYNMRLMTDMHNYFNPIHQIKPKPVVEEEEFETIMDYTGSLKDVIGQVKKPDGKPQSIISQKGVSTNVDHGGTAETLYKMINHEKGHKLLPINQKDEENYLRALRAEQTPTHAGWKRILATTYQLINQFPKCCDT